MFRSLNIAATGMVAQETKLDTIANNLANSNTSGFKRQEAEFEDLLYQQQRGAGRVPGNVAGPTTVELRSGPRLVAPPRIFTQGTIEHTANPHHIANEGYGCLVATRHGAPPAQPRHPTPHPVSARPTTTA